MLLKMEQPAFQAIRFAHALRLAILGLKQASVNEAAALRELAEITLRAAEDTHDAYEELCELTGKERTTAGQKMLAAAAGLAPLQ